jgi:hypothetical protein
VKKLIQLAMVSNKEVYQSLHEGKEDEASSYFKKVCEEVQLYAESHPTQQIETTKGTLFSAYNAITS